MRKFSIDILLYLEYCLETGDDVQPDRSVDGCGDTFNLLMRLTMCNIKDGLGWLINNVVQKDGGLWN